MALNQVVERNSQMEKTETSDRGESSSMVICGADYFNFLPEACIAVVISLTSVMDACRLATMSRIFRSAADSDPVWLRFLPSDYEAMLARSEEGIGMMDGIPKKEIYRRLVQLPVLIDAGTMSFWLDKETGKKCYMIAARKLDITWGADPRYWQWSSLPESRFSEVAELLIVWWLDIRGKMKTSMLSPDTNYAAYLVFNMTENADGFRIAAEVSVGPAGAEATSIEKVSLHHVQGSRQELRIVARRFGILGRARPPVEMQPRGSGEGHNKGPKRRSDGWLELKLGQFMVDEEDDREVEASLRETNCDHSKIGLVVEGIEFRPVVASS